MLSKIDFYTKGNAKAYLKIFFTYVLLSSFVWAVTHTHIMALIVISWVGIVAYVLIGFLKYNHLIQKEHLKNKEPLRSEFTFFAPFGISMSILFWPIMVFYYDEN